MAASAAGRDSRRFIANSTLASQNPRNWRRAEHQLMIRNGARDMPDRFRREGRLASRGLQANHSANARGSRDKSSPTRCYDVLKMRSMLRNRLSAAFPARPRARSRLPFLGQIAQLVIAGGAQWRGTGGINRALRSRRLASSAPPQSSASSRGTVSGLPWSDQPRSQGEPSALPSPFCAAARRLRA